MKVTSVFWKSQDAKKHHPGDPDGPGLFRRQFSCMNAPDISGKKGDCLWPEDRYIMKAEVWCSAQLNVFLVSGKSLKMLDDCGKGVRQPAARSCRNFPLWQQMHQLLVKKCRWSAINYACIGNFDKKVKWNIHLIPSRIQTRPLLASYKAHCRFFILPNATWNFFGGWGEYPEFGAIEILVVKF